MGCGATKDSRWCGCTWNHRIHNHLYTSRIAEILQINTCIDEVEMFLYKDIDIYIMSLASIHRPSKTLWNMSLQTTSTVLGGWVGFFIILSGQNYPPPKKKKSHPTV